MRQSHSNVSCTRDMDVGRTTIRRPAQPRTVYPRAPMCIKPEALLSGLVGRVEREGYLVTVADLDALLAAGLTKDTIGAHLARLSPTPAALHAQRTLDAR